MATYTPAKLNKGPKLPLQCYRVVCMSVKHALSAKKGTPQSTLKVQVLSPAQVTLKDGTVVDTAAAEGDMVIYYSEKTLPYVMEMLSKLGIEGPKEAESEAAYIDAVQQLVAGLEGQTWEMTAKSIKTQQIDEATNQPLKDSTGKEIAGFEKNEFNSMNVVGNRIALKDLGA